MHRYKGITADMALQLGNIVLMLATATLADEGRRSESLLDLQDIKPGTHCMSTGTLCPNPSNSKGASNVGVLLDSGGPGILRTNLE